MKKLILFLILLLIGVTNVVAWTNPLTLQNEWSLYGIGDPYILKHRGTYYLYVSTKDNNTGIKCWSTKDFITWSDAITCSTDPVTKTAYAPEVFYWNGMFYMYTSPGGGGHYILTSTSPTGPFVPVTGNIGKSIDGSVFVNDDGNWYFYHADGNGIIGCTMSGPLSVGAGVNLNSRVGTNWTEGPCVFKRNGIYYLIYTGNHVISKGYRVDYATSTSGPVSGFVPQAARNPILINTEGQHVGLGHGSAFIGPDLDSYYFTYHNLAGDFGVGPYRRLNFDRIAWNGDKMLMLGPTTWAQQPMQQADMADYFDRAVIGTEWELRGNGSWSVVNADYLSQSTSDGENYSKALHAMEATASYTAEFTLKEAENSGGAYGILFDYTDDANYTMVLLNSTTNQIELHTVVNNTPGTVQKSTMPTSFKHAAWHGMRVERAGENYKIFIDGMLRFSVKGTAGGGRIGYVTKGSKAHFGYIALSNQVNGSGVFDVYKPVPGNVEAVHYRTGGQGIGYYETTEGNTGRAIYRGDDVDIRTSPEGGFAITGTQPGEWYAYQVNVKSAGRYNLELRYASLAEGSQIRILQADSDLSGIVTLPSTGGTGNWSTVIVKNLLLAKGNQLIKLECVSGDFDFYNLKFVAAENGVTAITDTFQPSFSSHWNYIDGPWTINNGEAVISGYGKRTLGNTGWSDYTVETAVTYTNNMNGGLIFRVNNPALGGAGKDAALGTDFYQGYFVTLGAGSVVLGKQNYNWKLLRTAPGTYSLNTQYNLKVEVEGATIKVFVDDMVTPKIEYTDPDPFLHGKVGLRVHNSTIRFDNFSVSTTPLQQPSGVEPVHQQAGVVLYPNPVANTLRFPESIGLQEVTIFNTDGRKMYSERIPERKNNLYVGFLSRGIYFVQLKDHSGYIYSHKFVKE